jgi:hypothetical protein
MSSLTTELLPDITGSLTVTKGRIRPLVESDVAQIRDLSQRIGGDRVPSSASLLKRLFFDSPWLDNNVCSLAYEDRDGSLLGCLGMMPRPMIFRDRPIRAVVGHHFVIDPSRAGARAGIELARRFLGGPQDLSLAVWNDFGRRIWTSLGGSVTPLHSFSWTRALRPARNILGLLIGRRAFPLRPSTALADNLDVVTMLSCLSAFVSDRALKPHYDISSLAWLLDTLGEGDHRAHLHKVAVRTQSGRPLGWYVYYLGPSRVAEVLQMGGKEEALPEVLRHLFNHARQRGAVSVSGPMDARLVGALSESHCTFHRPRNAWALIQSRDARIAQAIHAGDAFLSRLESAGWPGSDSSRT